MNNQDAKKFGMVISLLRVQNNWTLKQLEQYSGVPFQDIHRVETCEHETTIAVLNKLLKPFSKKIGIVNIDQRLMQ